MPSQAVLELAELIESTKKVLDEEVTTADKILGELLPKLKDEEGTLKWVAQGIDPDQIMHRLGVRGGLVLGSLLRFYNGAPEPLRSVAVGTAQRVFDVAENIEEKKEDLEKKKLEKKVAMDQLAQAMLELLTKAKPVAQG